MGKEEKALGTTLHTVHVIVYMEKGDGQRKARHDDTINLARSPGIPSDSRNEHDLDDGQYGKIGHHETLLESVDFLSRGGGDSVGIGTVSRHFYYLPRK